MESLMRQTRDFLHGDVNKVVVNIGCNHFIMNFLAALFTVSAFVFSDGSFFQGKLHCDGLFTQFYTREVVNEYCWETISFETGCK